MKYLSGSISPSCKLVKFEYSDMFIIGCFEVAMLAVDCVESGPVSQLFTCDLVTCLELE